MPLCSFFAFCRTFALSTLRRLLCAPEKGGDWQWQTAAPHFFPQITSLEKEYFDVSVEVEKITQHRDKVRLQLAIRQTAIITVLAWSIQRVMIDCSEELNSITLKRIEQYNADMEKAVHLEEAQSRLCRAQEQTQEIEQAVAALQRDVKNQEPLLESAKKVR